MKTGCLAVGLILVWAVTAAAQKIEFEFEIYGGDAKIIDAVQARLLQGGEPAVKAVSKLPDLARAGQVELVE